MTIHLDLGSGSSLRNPFHADEVIGTDQSDLFRQPNIVVCNLGFEALPFPQNHFDSVSAFDLLEHIPRQSVDFKTGQSTFPFIFLMSEIHRVLKPEGVFLALTPAYPSKHAFEDPTHVNYIGENTHSFFCNEGGYLSRYGFHGRFKEEYVAWVKAEEFLSNKTSIKFRMKKWVRQISRKGLTHRVWKLRAVKAES